MLGQLSKSLVRTVTLHGASIWGVSLSNASHLPAHSQLPACMLAQWSPKAQLHPRHYKCGSHRRWSLLPWLLSTKEAFLLSYPSGEERPSASEGNEEFIEQQDSRLGTARALAAERVFWLGKCLAWLSQHCIVLPVPFPPVLPTGGRTPVTSSM